MLSGGIYACKECSKSKYMPFMDFLGTNKRQLTVGCLLVATLALVSGRSGGHSHVTLTIQVCSLPVYMQPPA